VKSILAIHSDGFDPSRGGDPIYVEDKAAQAYMRMDAVRYHALVKGPRAA
jgi:hypothetical protein